MNLADIYSDRFDVLIEAEKQLKNRIKEKTIEFLKDSNSEQFLIKWIEEYFGEAMLLISNVTSSIRKRDRLEWDYALIRTLIDNPYLYQDFINNFVDDLDDSIYIELIPEYYIDITYNDCFNRMGLKRDFDFMPELIEDIFRKHKEEILKKVFTVQQDSGCCTIEY